MIWGKTNTQRLAIYEKHKWFAWYPVKLNDGRWIWWEWTWQQRLTNSHGMNSWDRERIIGKNE